jgi:hypothetical protein
MKKYDLSDRKLKIAIILAMAMIAWLCLKGASASDGQSTPANFSSCRQIVRHLYVGVYPRHEHPARRPSNLLKGRWLSAWGAFSFTDSPDGL